MGAGQSRRNRHRRKARPGDEQTYDGVSDFKIYSRDHWSCQMPECLCPDGRAIDPASFQRRPERGMTLDPWRASIDHIIPLADGGWDIASNKRAAHALCNEAAQEHYRLSRVYADAVSAGAAVRERERGLRYTIGDVWPGGHSALSPLI